MRKRHARNAHLQTGLNMRVSTKNFLLDGWCKDGPAGVYDFEGVQVIERWKVRFHEHLSYNGNAVQELSLGSGKQLCGINKIFFREWEVHCRFYSMALPIWGTLYS